MSAATHSCISFSTKNFMSSKATFATKYEKSSPKRLETCLDEDKPLSGLPVDLRGKRAFIARVADGNRYGWAIAISLAAAGAEILIGKWVPALNIFESSVRCGKFDESRLLPDGSLMEISKIYPLDAVYDNPEDVSEDVMILLMMLMGKINRRYAGSSKWTVQV
ncbi:hypothetical protein CICLE_v10013442mg [Citrus x clementina]|uniref:Uncharacterized protein n=1 Tax=Citrus clementina TaxID=85681 RepID=V4SQW0_CITCL|nr:hypothetical protein CICLE_v10013442mg [Citrus x clementina]